MQFLGQNDNWIPEYQNKRFVGKKINGLCSRVVFSSHPELEGPFGQPGCWSETEWMDRMDIKIFFYFSAKQKPNNECIRNGTRERNQNIFAGQK